MAISVLDADQYISDFCLDIDDWQFSDDSRKKRFINVANRTLVNEFPTFVIPDKAVYEFANVLSIGFNDVNRLQSHGIENFTLVGMGTFEFRERMVKAPHEINFADLIPPIALAMINEENGITKSKNRIKWTGV